MILDSLHERQGRSALILFAIAALLLKYTSADRVLLKSSAPFRVASALSIIVIVGYLVVLASYLMYPNYLDHLEATVASISWLSLHGHPVYPNWADGDIYGLLYGPILYILDGSVLLIYPTLMASKLPSMLALLVAFYCFYAVIKEKVASKLGGIILVASAIVLIAPFWLAFSIRAEPFLICISVVALLAATKLRPLVAAAVIGALAGIAVGLKIHGFVYVLPVVTMLFGKIRNRRDQIKFVAIVSLCACLVALLPFCLNQNSLSDYFQYLEIATKHGFDPELLDDNLRFTLVLFAPIIAIWFWRRPKINAPEIWALGGLFVSIAITVVVGAKVGAGSHHLVPFVPLCLYSAVAMSNLPAKTADRIAVPIFIVLLIAYSPSYVQTIQLSRDFYRQSQSEHTKIVELEKFLNAYPDAQIGPSDSAHYSDTFFRVVPVLQGRVLRVDFAAWIDLEYGGVNEATLARFFERCEIPTWILPLGTPFSTLNLYSYTPLLSDKLRQTFLTNYKMILVGQSYQVWRCSLLAQDSKN